MSAPHSIPVLAIDGGGTHCRIAAVEGEEVTLVEVGSANVSTDFERARRQIEAGVAQLSEITRISTDDLYQRPAYVALAGVTDRAVAERLRSALAFRTVEIHDDRPAALRGAIGKADGFLAHCGTGSFFGAQGEQQMRLVGGWGSVLGDEASAQWIGRKALSAALDTVDGMRDPSGLTEALLEEFSGSSGIVAYAKAAEPAALGVIAQQVTEAAHGGDPVAVAVMQAGAEHISNTLRILGWRPGARLCLTGGIGPYFRDHLPEDMQADVLAPQGTPLDGAISMAREFAQGVAP